MLSRPKRSKNEAVEPYEEEEEAVKVRFTRSCARVYCISLPGTSANTLQWTVRARTDFALYLSSVTQPQQLMVSPSCAASLHLDIG
jgi:hypothetical protein